MHVIKGILGNTNLKNNMSPWSMTRNSTFLNFCFPLSDRGQPKGLVFTRTSWICKCVMDPNSLNPQPSPHLIPTHHPPTLQWKRKYLGTQPFRTVVVKAYCVLGISFQLRIPDLKQFYLFYNKLYLSLSINQTLGLGKQIFRKEMAFQVGRRI